MVLRGNSIKRTTDYWLQTAAHDYDTMRALYKGKRYSDCLFFGHLALEKVLKASVVIKTNEHPPYTHNLSYLAELAGVKFSPEEKALLARVNEFNLQARYPDERLEFYKLATKQYADHYYEPIQKLYRRLCRFHKQK